MTARRRARPRRPHTTARAITAALLMWCDDVVETATAATVELGVVEVLVTGTAARMVVDPDFDVAEEEEEDDVRDVVDDAVESVGEALADDDETVDGDEEVVVNAAVVVGATT